MTVMEKVTAPAATLKAKVDAKAALTETSTKEAASHMSKGLLHEDHPQDDMWVESTFASRFLGSETEPVPKDEMPRKSMPANVAVQLVRDLRQLDANPRLNLASFVTTWMEPEAEALIKESSNVNFVDVDMYPSSTEIQNRCVAMLAKLYHAPANKAGTAVGTATIGSSEAILLAGLALKRQWEDHRKKQGKPIDKPNLVMGYNVQVCWEKFTRYFDVEENFVALAEDCYVLTAEGARAQCDENTIGVVGILGSTYTGEFEDIVAIDAMVEELNAKNGWKIGVHVDAASGGFVAPFTSPDLKWDFRLKNVVSINVSGHKYGLVYPGLGWVIWRSPECLPESLVFHTNYLGSDQPSITLNFSKSASMIVAQYYQFLRLGFEGYQKIMLNLMAVARRFEKQLVATGHFIIMSKPDALPLVAFRLNKIKTVDGKEEPRTYDEFDLADKIKSLRGWILPAYTMAPHAKHVKLLRAVIREDLSMSMVDELISDIRRAVEWLDHHIIFTEEQMENLKKKFQTHRTDENEIRAVKHNAGVC